MQQIALIFHHEGVAVGKHKLSQNAFLSCAKKLIRPLAAQVLDLRSASAKEAGKAI